MNEYAITEAIPRLQALQERLQTSLEPGAPYEWTTVNRILGNLNEGGSPGNHEAPEYSILRLD